MMKKEKILTNEGVKEVEKIDGIDEVEDIDLPSEVVAPKNNQSPTTNPTTNYIPNQIIEPSKQQITEKIREVNQDPETQKYKAKVMKKSTYWTILGFAIFFIVLFATNVIWSNTAFSLKDFGANITMNNNNDIDVAGPEITTPINNNFTIVNNNQISIPEDIMTNLTKEIADRILSELNWTNNVTNSS